LKSIKIVFSGVARITECIKFVNWKRANAVYIYDNFDQHFMYGTERISI